VVAVPAFAASPVVLIDAPATATTGQPVAFDGDATSDPDGDPMTYVWSIDGQVLDVETSWLSVAFAHPGTHRVALTATDAGGAATTLVHTIAVTGIDRLPSSLKPLGTSLAPGVQSAPELVVRAAAVRLRDGRLRVELRCRGAKRCRGTLRIVALKGRTDRPYLLAQRAFDVAAGGPRIVHVRLGPRARGRLGHQTRVRATAFRGRVRIASIWGTAAYRVPVAR
jgi:PKD repeat protein